MDPQGMEITRPLLKVLCFADFVHPLAPCWAEYFEQHVLRTLGYGPHERRQTMNITTNNIPRPLACFLDLPEKARADFDYLTEDEAYDCRLVQYKGVWYDVYDSMTCPGAVATDDTRHLFSGWDGYISDSFFSGVLFKFADEDRVVCATYTC